METNAPLYIKAYSFSRYIIERMEVLCGKRYRIVADSLCENALSLIHSITLALKGINKASNIVRTDEILNLMRIDIRLLYDLAIFNLKQLEFLTKELEEIGRMVGGWKKRI